MDFSVLKNAVDEAILVDAHAHNLIAPKSTLPFIACFSQLDDVPHYNSLSFKRNLRDIVELYDCKPSLHGIEEHRKSSGFDSICSTCFKAARISVVLLDDGLRLDKQHNIEWHTNFVPIVGRILRIERLAEDILDEEFEGGCCWTLDAFTETYLQKLKSSAHEIYGLKSVAPYRTGLDINVNVSRKHAEEGLLQVLQGGKPVRIANKSLIDYIFIISLEVAQQFNLPMQIHTGFGDKDLDLRLANPLLLRSVLEDKRFSKCRIVLLHASYPFSKEASHLASIYAQVHLDFGLPIPRLSVHGMISALKQLLELAPIKKVMFSTNAYAFPELFYLGAKKSRDVVFSVLRDACIDGDLSISEAVEAVNDMFAQNALKLYNINLPTTNSTSISNGSLFSIIPSMNTDVVLQKDARLVRIIWVDASGRHRCRVIPFMRLDVIKRNGISLSFACMGLPSYADYPADGTNLTATGEIRLMPDLSTKRIVPWKEQEEMVIGDMYIGPGEAWEYCPREALRRVSRILKNEFDLEMKAGFEIEFLLLKKAVKDGKEDWVPFVSSFYCSTSSYDVVSPFFDEVVASLTSLNITVEQLHGEAGKSQFEIVLGYTTCLSAADELIYTREVIKAIARKHGLLATFLPKYAMDDSGSGSHVHVSLWQKGKNVFMADDESSKHGMSTIGEEFMAGVLHHIPSLLPFIAPIPNSYDRIQPNRRCGAYQCWGTDNKESPIRTARPHGIGVGSVSNFEIKSFDGCANPYLGLAAILCAGLDGLRNHLHLPEPIDTDPSDIGLKLQRLPQSLSESLEALENNNNTFTNLIGERLLVVIKAIRKAEVKYYSEHQDAYKQLIHHY